MKTPVRMTLLAVSILTIMLLSSLFCSAIDLGMLSEGREGFEDFIPPITSAFVFEDPLVCTEFRPSFLWQEISDDDGAPGGYVWLVGNPTRIALGKKVALTNWKYGYANVEPDFDPFGQGEGWGWGDLGLGIKFALIRDEENRFLLTPGLNYEFSQGSPDVLQGNGEGLWMPYISAGKGLGNFHLLGSVACGIPVDRESESTSLYYGLHLDYMINETFYPMIELNGQHVLNEGNATDPFGNPIRFEGNDVINIGSAGVDGNDIITLAVGLYYKIMDNVAIGGAYERPITDREGLMKERVTLALSIKL